MPASIADSLALPCGVALSNRLMKSAMTEGLADPGNQPTPELASLYRRWSEGGAGLLMSGNVMVDRDHLERAGNVVLDEAVDRSGLRAWAEAGRVSGNHFWMQISHPGRQCPKAVNPHPVSASDVQLKLGGQFGRPRALSEAEIADVIEAFALAATLARKSGFSGVQIHAAHGYLVSQFLSPVTNRRKDQWGGSLENRGRLLRLLVQRVRAAVGKDFPVSVKLNSADFQKGGFTLEDCLQVVEWLSDDGVDLLEISGGSYEQPRLAGMVGSRKTYEMPKRESTLQREAFFLRYAEVIRPAARMPLAVTGGFRQRSTMTEALEKGVLDLIGMARPFCADPDVSRKLSQDHLSQASTIQERLRLGPGVFGPNSPVPMVRAMNMMAQMGWCGEQIFRMSRSGPPDLDLGAWAALRTSLRRDRQALARRSEARRVG